MIRTRFAILAAALQLALPMAATTAQAQVTQYTTLAEYLAAVSNDGTDTFNDLGGSPELFFGPRTRTAGAYGYSVYAQTDPFLLYAIANGDITALSTLSPRNAIVFDSFNAAVRGIGGNFFLTDEPGYYLAGDVLLQWTEVGGATGSFTLTQASTNSFFGVVSAGGGFTSFSVRPGVSLNEYATADNLVLGAAVSTVPEPSTYALMAAGLAALGLVARRRRRALAT